MPKPLGSVQATLLSGLVVAAHGKHYRVEMSDGRVLECVTRGKKTGVACGDQVSIALSGESQGAIEGIGPRTNLLYRSDPFKQKIIAANLSQVVIVTAAVPAFYEELLNRCLVAAEAQDIAVLIVANKTDLPETAHLIAELESYAALGYEVLPLCAKQAVDALRTRLIGHRSVLVGQSGMGKSTLINGLLPTARAKEGELSVVLDSGKHTTTHATLYHLDTHSQLIDSPGVQAFGLHHLDLTQLAAAFPEFRPFTGDCRFHNCRHLNEPGCALEQAVRDGTIASKRLAFYRVLALERQRAPPHYKG